MQNERLSKFNDKPVRIGKIVLADANLLLLPIMNSITKFSMGETDLFSHFKLQDLENIQKVMCKYITWVETGANITLFDLSENIQDFMGITIEFLEYNFGFFSQSRKVLQRISGQFSEKKETTSQN